MREAKENGERKKMKRKHNRERIRKRFRDINGWRVKGKQTHVLF